VDPFRAHSTSALTSLRRCLACAAYRRQARTGERGLAPGAVYFWNGRRPQLSVAQYYSGAEAGTIVVVAVGRFNGAALKRRDPMKRLLYFVVAALLLGAAPVYKTSADIKIGGEAIGNLPNKKLTAESSMLIAYR
jgi:hypothetical protein